MNLPSKSLFKKKLHFLEIRKQSAPRTEKLLTISKKSSQPTFTRSAADSIVRETNRRVKTNSARPSAEEKKRIRRSGAFTSTDRTRIGCKYASICFFKVSDQFWELVKTDCGFKIRQSGKSRKAIDLLKISNRNELLSKENTQLKKAVANFDSILEMIKNENEHFFLNKAEIQRLEGENVCLNSKLTEESAKLSTITRKYDLLVESLNRGAANSTTGLVDSIESCPHLEQSTPC